MVITRYMTDDKANRIVAHIFCPELAPGEELADSTPGTAQLAARELPSDIWGFPKDLADGVPYGVWKARMEYEGFIYD